ncbi:UDP-glycosyltransferase 87A2-like isoform X3 [Prosopis cineraria]|uniref:UDP-glycosyltransferase 87A2-like isoform X3 n=1 Tax=Prosopis cineraria TaxID=364024 RepID=UPI0024105E26|nr:UDP-glycosyltransferase 87A2-like isoform X3 [Prosopis cineraria]
MEAPPCLKKHVVAVPFPTRGHVNPMMNLCKFLASRTSDVIITFVVTEEWLSYIESYPKPHTIRYATIPNVIPLESQILDDICRFSQAIVTKMRDAFEQLLDQLNPPVTAIVADVELVWPTSVAHKRNIPVALLWTMSASFFCTYLQLDYMLASGRRLAADLLGPAIPFLELEPSSDSSTTDSDHIIKWLDFQPNMSVLYISVGSFLSMSRPQMEELASALKGSGIRFLWACRSEAEWLREKCGDKGLVVPWCDQLKVLCHGSIVGFWSHGGWNSTVEACFAAVPILGFPIFLDQFSNCRHIAEEWKNGWKVGGERSESFVTKEEIVQVLEMVMDLESKEGKKIRDKAKELKPLFRGAIAKGGSFNMNLDAFVQDILDVHGDLSPVEKP